MDSRMRNITVKITVEVFIITISDLYLISYFIVHLHKFYVYRTPHLSKANQNCSNSASCYDQLLIICCKKTPKQMETDVRKRLFNIHPIVQQDMFVHFKDTKCGRIGQRQKKCCETELNVPFPSSLRLSLGEEEGFKEGNTDCFQSFCVVPQFLSFDIGKTRPFCNISTVFWIFSLRDMFIWLQQGNNY